MTDDPNKKQNDPNYAGGQTGQQQDKQPEQRKNPDGGSPKRPSQGGHDVEQDQEQDQSGKRRAS
jgi:hypothetical protein